MLFPKAFNDIDLSFFLTASGRFPKGLYGTKSFWKKLETLHKRLKNYQKSKTNTIQYMQYNTIRSLKKIGTPCILLGGRISGLESRQDQGNFEDTLRRLNALELKLTEQVF